MISHDPRHRGRRYLQCTTMGWFPVLLCTLSTSSMTSVMVARLVHTPSGDQLVMWNWVTCCIWVLCVFCADQSQIIIRYLSQCIMNVRVITKGQEHMCVCVFIMYKCCVVECLVCLKECTSSSCDHYIVIHHMMVSAIAMIKFQVEHQALLHP